MYIHIHVNISLQYNTMQYDTMRWDAAQYIYIYAYSCSLYTQYILHYTLYILHLHSTFYIHIHIQIYIYIYIYMYMYMYMYIHVYIWKTPPIFGCVPLSLDPWAIRPCCLRPLICWYWPTALHLRPGRRWFSDKSQWFRTISLIRFLYII